MKILGTGLNGLVGSRIVELLSSKFEFENIDRVVGIDITDKKSVQDKILNSNAEILLHLAAKTNVDDCEKDKSLGKKGDAWNINVEGTKNIAEACQISGKKLIYISTDFVFDGTKIFYFEEDQPNPLNWYAQTKYEGEKIVQELKSPWIIARISFPYRANFERPDFFRAILSRLQQGQNIMAVEDQIFTPTFIDDIVLGLEALIKNNSEGVYHVIGGQSLSPFHAANLIADKFNLDKSKIIKTTRNKYFKNRAARPFQLALKNDKITKVGVQMKTFEEGLIEIVKQRENL